MKTKLLNLALVILTSIAFSFQATSQETKFQVQWNGYTATFTVSSGFEQTSPTTVRSALKTAQTVKSISLSKGVCSAENELYKWFLTARSASREKRDIVVKLLNSYNQVVKSWRVVQASPVKFDSVPMNATGTDVAIENLVLGYEKIEPE